LLFKGFVKVKIRGRHNWIGIGSVDRTGIGSVSDRFPIRSRSDPIFSKDDRSDPDPPSTNMGIILKSPLIDPIRSQKNLRRPIRSQSDPNPIRKKFEATDPIQKNVPTPGWNIKTLHIFKYYVLSNNWIPKHEIQNQNQSIGICPKIDFKIYITAEDDLL
jgi:hypothetical protein